MKGANMKAHDRQILLPTMPNKVQLSNCSDEH